MSYKRDIRNTRKAWFLLGLLENHKHFKDTTGYMKEEEMQDYHNMLAHNFNELKSIYNNGGLKINIDLKDEKGYRNMIFIPVIQFIIGDCKGNDVFCGRKGTHSLNTPRLCRDCDMPSSEADDVDQACVFN